MSENDSADSLMASPLMVTGTDLPVQLESKNESGCPRRCFPRSARALRVLWKYSRPRPDAPLILPGEHDGEVASGGLVGREAALASLRTAVDDSLTGRGRLFLIVGEAGIGKTALAAGIAEYATEQDVAVLWATCWSGDGAPPYWPWVQVLRALEPEHSEGTPAVATPAEARRILPDLVNPPTGRSSQGTSGERFALFDAVASFLLNEARAQPLLVIVDDLQWADTPSLLLLNFLARQVKSGPLMVLGTFRDDEVSVDRQRAPLLAEARSQAEVIALTGLATDEVEQLIGAMSGTRLWAGLAPVVHRRSGGNPFFVREVTQLLLSRSGPDETGVPGGIPDAVRQVVAQRLARLPQVSVALLTVAAVAGREISGDLLARVTGAGLEEVAQRMDVVVRARMLLRPRGPAGPFRFSHDLIRETVYDDLHPGVRADLHLRLGRALQSEQAEGSIVRPAELAQHLLLAAIGEHRDNNLAEESASYGILAAQESMARLAYEDAVAHIQRQIDGLGSVGLLREPILLNLLLRRADALRCAGDYAAARVDYRNAEALALRSARRADLAEVALGVQALGVESGTSRTNCVALLEDALDRLRDKDSAITARVLAALARELFLADVAERPRARVLSRAAVDMAGRVGDDDALAVALLAAHDTTWLPGMAERRRGIAAQLQAVARRAGDGGLAAEACLLRALAGLELAEPQALSVMAEFDRLGTAVGQPHYRYLVLTRRAAMATMTGRLVEAERLIVEAAGLAERTGEPDAWNMQTRQLWRLRSLHGRRQDVEQQLRKVPIHLLKFWFDAQLALILFDRGERSEALRLTASALQTRPEELAFPYVLAVQWAELGEAAIAAGLLAACERFYNTLRPYAGTTIVSAAVVSFDGTVDHHLGVFAAALGRTEDAAQHLENAVALHERLTAWPWLAWSRYELAVVLARRDAQGDRVRVTALLNEVQQAARDFDLPGLASRATAVTLPQPNEFRRDGDAWLISYAGKQIRLRDVKGLGDIAALLFAQGRPVPAATLAGAGVPGTAEFGGDLVLDDTARQQYRTRLADLDHEVDDANTRHDLARASALDDERAFLIRELASAVGLGQRGRRLGDDRERARKAVTGRIKDAIARINAVHPALADHLSRSISTGHLCVYHPDRVIRWESAGPPASSPDRA